LKKFIRERWKGFEASQHFDELIIGTPAPSPRAFFAAKQIR
jgi:hypothetical protein